MQTICDFGVHIDASGKPLYSCSPENTPSVTVMQLFSDKDIRAEFGLSDAKIGDIIGKTRQAVNTGIQKSDSYFKLHELRLIFLHLRNGGAPATDLLILSDYIKRRFPEWMPPNFAPSSIDTSADLTMFRNVVCIIADYRAFKEFNPDCQKVILKGAISLTTKLQIYTSSQFELDLLVEDIRVEARSEGKDLSVGDEDGMRSVVSYLPEANQYPYMLCCDPDLEKGSFFVIASNMFVPMDNIRGKAVFHFIRKSLANIESELIVAA